MDGLVVDSTLCVVDVLRIDPFDPFRRKKNRKEETVQTMTLRLADQSLLKILLEFLTTRISNDDDTCNFIFDLTNDSFRKFRSQSLSPTRTTIPPTTPNTPVIKTSLFTYPTTNPNVTQRDRVRFS